MVCLEGGSSLSVNSDVQGFHACVELAPLDIFDMFPNQGNRKTPSDFEDHVCNVVFWAEASTSKDRLCSYFGGDALDWSSVVGGDANPGRGGGKWLRKRWSAVVDSPSPMNPSMMHLLLRRLCSRSGMAGISRWAEQCSRNWQVESSQVLSRSGKRKWLGVAKW